MHLQSSHYSGWRHSWSCGSRSCGPRHSASTRWGCQQLISPCWLLWSSAVFSEASLSIFSVFLHGHHLIIIASYYSSWALLLIFNLWCSFGSAQAERTSLCLGSTWIIIFSILWCSHQGSYCPSAWASKAHCSQRTSPEQQIAVVPMQSHSHFQPWSDQSFWIRFPKLLPAFRCYYYCY